MIEQLQGVPIAASVLDTEILAARVYDYSPAMLDTLLGAGEVTWTGVEPLGDRDGRIALYLTDHLGKLLPPERARGQGATKDSPGAKRRSSRICIATARRSSARYTRPRAAAFRRRPSTRSGIWCGRGC